MHIRMAFTTVCLKALKGRGDDVSVWFKGTNVCHDFSMRSRAQIDDYESSDLKGYTQLRAGFQAKCLLKDQPSTFYSLAHWLLFY